MYFSLDRKVPKDQDCKKPTKNKFTSLRKKNSTNFVGLKQLFSLHAPFIDSLYADFLRSNEDKKQYGDKEKYM